MPISAFFCSKRAAAMTCRISWESAAPPRVYIAAFAPDKGESVTSLIKGPERGEHPCRPYCRRGTVS
jgi:hypothetical protein